MGGTSTLEGGRIGESMSWINVSVGMLEGISAGGLSILGSGVWGPEYFWPE